MKDALSAIVSVLQRQQLSPSAPFLVSVDDGLGCGLLTKKRGATRPGVTLRQAQDERTGCLLGPPLAPFDRLRVSGGVDYRWA